MYVFFFQAEDGIRVVVRSRGLGDGYKRQGQDAGADPGLALQLGGSALNVIWSLTGYNQSPSILFGTQMSVMVANAFVMANSAAGAISVRPEAAGTDADEGN